MTQITIEIPERLAPRLEPVQPYVIEFMEAGLHEMNLEGNPLYQELLAFFRSNPTPQQIAAVKASAPINERIEWLLWKNRTDQLTAQEEEEFLVYQTLNRFIVLVKLRVQPHPVSAT